LEKDIGNVIRKEEINISKKLYRPTNPSLFPSNVNLRDSGYASVMGGDMSPRSLANMTQGKDMNDFSLSHSSDDDDDITSNSEDSQFEAKRKQFGDFNERYQSLIDRMKLEDEQQHRSYDQILGIGEDFLESSKRYGRIIIDEAYLDESEKTIKPVASQSYVFKVGHIVFELCSGNDSRFSENLSYEMSAKSMGHQLKSFAALEDVNSTLFSLPLLAIFDFRGFRLVAACKLPITQSTLIYGPMDGQFFDKQAAVLQELKSCSKKLNLKPSFCGVGKKRHRVVGGYGMQVHEGLDQRHYVVQASDLYPCVKPQEKHGRKPEKGSSYVELFRPEFIQSYPVSLSSNAYKSWAAGMPDDEENRLEVDEATRWLETVLIPTFAKDLTVLVTERERAGSLRINELMHEYGLNVRCLGLVLIQMTISNQAHMLLLVEMIARVLKIELRAQMRKKEAKLKLVTNEPYKALVAAFFDLIFAKTKASDTFWTGFITQKLEQKFGISKITWSDFPEYLKGHVFEREKARIKLFDLLCQMTGAVFVPQVPLMIRTAYTKLDRIFTYETVVELKPVIKQLDFMSEARGWLYQARGGEHESRGFFSSAKHFFSASMQAYKTALSRSPVNATLLRSLGEVTFKFARLESAIAQSKRNLSMVQLDLESPLLQQAKSYFVRAIKAQSEPINFATYAHFMENLQMYDRAEALYLQALTVNPNHVYILVRYGQFLSHTRNLYEIADLFFARAKAITAAAIEMTKAKKQSRPSKDGPSK
jgi:tetratricopeptide (TPR) repeat protein